MPVHFVAGADCPLCFQDEVSLDSLLAHPFILTEKKMSYRRLLDEKLAALSREIQPVLEIGSTGLICSLVEQNAGVSFSAGFRHRTGSAGGPAVSSAGERAGNRSVETAFISPGQMDFSPVGVRTAVLPESQNQYTCRLKICKMNKINIQDRKYRCLLSPS